MKKDLAIFEGHGIRRLYDEKTETWQKHGCSEKWIQQRMTGQETRNKLTDYWAGHEIKKDDEYAQRASCLVFMLDSRRLI